MTDKQYNSDDIRNIIISDINKKYAKGKIGPFEVIIMKSNGFINATKLCKEAGKKFTEWTKNKSSKEFIKVVTASDGKSSDELFIQILDNNLLKGTYVHHDLIIPIAMWCSAEYAFKVTRLIKEYEIKQAIEEKDAIIGKKDDKIDKLSAKIDKLIAINEGQSAMLEEIHDQNDELNEKLSSACHSRVVDGKPSKRNMLAIVKNNAKPKKNDPPYYDYKVFRVAKRSFNSLFNAHKVKYPKSDIIFKIDYTPNSVQLWQRFLEKYHHTLDHSGCQFNLGPDTTLKKTLRRIKTVHHNRYDV